MTVGAFAPGPTLLRFPDPSPVDLDALMDFVQHEVDPADFRSLRAAAPLLAGLAHDATLIERYLDRQITAALAAGGASTFALQPLTLAQAGHARLLAIAWPSAAELASGRVPMPLDAVYGVASDHIEHRLAAGHLGPGCETVCSGYERTDLYDGVRLKPSTPVRARLTRGTLIASPACRAVQCIEAPAQLSWSLELRLATPAMQAEDRYVFDADRSELSRREPCARDRRAIAALRMAAIGTGADVEGGLLEIARAHRSPHLRSAAWIELIRRNPEQGDAWRKEALRDANSLVHQEIRKNRIESGV